MTTVILYALLIFTVSLIGGFLVVMHEWRPGTLSIFISFGAGVILTTAILFLIPTALERTSPLWILGGFLFIFLGENFIMMHTCLAEDCEVHHIGLAAFVGLSFHALAAGLAIGAGIIHSATLGFITFLAIIIHKAPESFSLASLLLHSRYSRRATSYLIILFALFVPTGIFFSYVILRRHALLMVPAALGFSAGTFLEVGAGDLLPQVHRHGPYKRLRLLGFILGVAISFSLLFIHLHG